MKILVIDIGGKSIKYRISENGKNSDIFKENINEAHLDDVLDILKEIYIKHNDVSGIAISAPGAILSNGFVNGITAIKGFDNFNLHDTIIKKLNFKGKLTILNDGNAAAYADYSTIEKMSSTVSLAVGTGIGAGIIINGKLIFGKDGFGGEVGMVTTFNHLDDKEFFPLTGSGSSGFFNTEKYYEELSGELIDGEQIFNLYEKNDLNAKKAIDRMYKGIAILIFNMAVTFNPDYFFISGGLSKRKTLIKELKPYIEKLHRNLSLKINLVNLKISPFDWSAQLEGALKYFEDN